MPTTPTPIPPWDTATTPNAPQNSPAAGYVDSPSMSVSVPPPARTRMPAPAEGPRAASVLVALIAYALALAVLATRPSFWPPAARMAAPAPLVVALLPP